MRRSRVSAAFTFHSTIPPRSLAPTTTCRNRRSNPLAYAGHSLGYSVRTLACAMLASFLYSTAQSMWCYSGLAEPLSAVHPRVNATPPSLRRWLTVANLSSSRPWRASLWSWQGPGAASIASEREFKFGLGAIAASELGSGPLRLKRSWSRPFQRTMVFSTTAQGPCGHVAHAVMSMSADHKTRWTHRQFTGVA